MVRLAVLTPGDPLDVSSWSGTPFHATRALQTHYADLVVIQKPRPVWFDQVRRAGRKLSAGYIDLAWSEGLARLHATKLARQLVSHGVDVTVCIGAAPLSAFLGDMLPVVHVSDATAALMRTYYQEFAGLHGGLAASADRLDRWSVQRAKACLFSSRWAARSALEDYGADPMRVHVVPFGANLDAIDGAGTSRESSDGVFNLAFVGLDWERKRGDLAVETARALVRRGYKVRLEVIGAVPPTPYDPDLVTVHGYVSKATPAGRALFQDIMGRAHLVLVPTKQECFGIFAAEANAYGLPVISTDTGGLADVIENGVNGYLLPLAAGAEAYADKIAEVFENRGLYENLRAGSLARSRTVLNWQAWGHRAAEVIDTVAHDKRA